MMPSGYSFLPCHFSKRLPYIAESISAAMVSLLRSCESTPHCGDSNLTATTTAAELGLPPVQGISHSKCCLGFVTGATSLTVTVPDGGLPHLQRLEDYMPLLHFLAQVASLT